MALPFCKQYDKIYRRFKEGGDCCIVLNKIGNCVHCEGP